MTVARLNVFLSVRLIVIFIAVGLKKIILLTAVSGLGIAHFSRDRNYIR